MIRPYELAIGLRYTRARRRSHFISFISLVSIVGIALGIAALITVLSVMNGFGKELRSRILGVVSHVTVTGQENTLTDWRAVAAKLPGDAGITGRAPYIAGQGMLTRGSRVNGVAVRGVLPAEEAQVSEFHARMMAGSVDDLKSGEFGIVIGSAIAWKLDLTVGSQVSLVIPQGQATPAGLLPRFKRFTVVGIFRMDMHDYDSGLALMHIDDAARLYQLGAAVSGLRLKLEALENAPAVADQLAVTLGENYRTRDWTREHGNFFRALKIEKTVMFVILLLIVTVAMFNVVSTLVVIVTEKRADIAILRTLGASPRSIMKIFLVQGAFVGIIGTAAGTLVGILLALNVETIVQGIEALFRTTFISADIYFISELPSDLQWSDVAWVAGSSLMLGLLSTLYPAWRASQVQPAEALRYE